MTRVTHSEWDDFLKEHPDAHLLQTSAWGQLKADFGWEMERIVVGEIGAQLLFQPVALGFQVAYLPRGPVYDGNTPWAHSDWPSFLDEVDNVCRERHAIFLKVEPDVWEEDVAAPDRPPSGFRISSHAIQPPRTIVISLQESEEDILGRMKSKTRYNTRLARRKEVVVDTSRDIDLFYDMLESTADRADFGIHNRQYFRRIYDLFAPQGECKLFVAEYSDKPLASILVFKRGTRSWYFYGASTTDHRDRMPTYLVQWEAMRWARDQGCRTYDLWGVPDHDEAFLEDHFLDRGEGLWGVYRFKRGFGGEVKRTAGPWDRIYRPVLYHGYRLWAGRDE